MNHLEVIEAVLSGATEPMSAKSIADEAIRRGLITEYGKTLHASFSRDINQNIVKGGSRFVKLAAGRFALAGSAAANVQPELVLSVGHSVPNSATDLQADKGLQILRGKNDARKRRRGKGFVYIMTNPSFRKSWIKIGYTAAGETVEQRRRSLSNSSVPYPFEVFATLRSDNAYDTEQRVHLALEAGGDSRLTPNREFFDLSPERALKAFKAIASEEAIDIYRDGKVVAHGLDIPVVKDKKRRRPSAFVPMANCVVFYCTASGADANGEETADGFVVLRGSRLAKIQPSMGKYAKAVYGRRIKLEQEGVIVGGVLKRQQSFDSPSAAACFVAGRNADGLHDWRTSDGTRLGQMKGVK